MWPVIVSVIVALASGLVAWYYKRQSDQVTAQQNSSVVVANKELVAKTDELLASSASKADAQNKVDQEHAKAISTAAGAAIFLSDSVPRQPAAGGDSNSSVRAAPRARAATFVCGFGRGGWQGCGDSTSTGSCGPGSVDSR